MPQRWKVELSQGTQCLCGGGLFAGYLHHRTSGLSLPHIRHRVSAVTFPPFQNAQRLDKGRPRSHVQRSLTVFILRIPHRDGPLRRLLPVVMLTVHPQPEEVFTGSQTSNHPGETHFPPPFFSASR